MNNSILSFIAKNRTACLYGGIIMAILGVALAYFTNDSEPWGTIGGFVCAISLIVAGVAASKG